MRKNAAVSLVGNGVAAVLSLLTTGLLARWIPRESFGNWILFLVSYTLFDTLRSGLLLNGIIQYTTDLPAGSVEKESAMNRWEGAVWQLGLCFTLGVGPLLIGLVHWFPLLRDWIGSSETVVWFWIISLVSLPANIATWFLHARSRFGPLQWVRILSQALFLFLIVPIHWLGRLPDYNLYVLYAFANALVSAWTVVSGWSRWQSVRRGTVVERSALLHFGKFTIGTLVGSNLLRSVDTLLLGAVLGPEAVAVYAIPRRLMQLLDLPVRSVIVTAMPQLVKLHNQGQVSAFTPYFQRSAGLLWVALLPLSVAGFVLAEPLVLLLGGGQYRDGATLMRCFMIYGAFLPLDRYSGAGLDAIGKPGANLFKVLVMLVVQVLGSLLALVTIQSTTALATVSIVTFMLGMFIGFRLMNRHVPVSLTGSVQAGWIEFVGLFNRLRHEWIRPGVKSVH
ncbi:hypothetical protein GCM10027423_05790 [Spirosoma arcticum]